MTGRGTTCSSIAQGSLQSAAIIVEADDGNQYNLFFTANEALPSNTIEESAGGYWTFFPAASFHPVVELLREEAPM